MSQRPPTRPEQPARRDFLTASLAAAGGLAGVSLTGCATPIAAAVIDETPLEPWLKPGDTVLFQGDSITDAGRSRKTAANVNDQSALGRGYAWLASAGLLVQHEQPEGTEPRNVRIFNRGISGHKVFQLANRWQRDCLDLKPDLVSILIGVNDVWHKKNGKYDGTVEIYERDYDALLARTKKELPGVRLVVCEPFVLRCGAINESWFPEFDHYRAAARKLADKHGAAFVPFQSMFDKASQYAPPQHWAKDGVHPSKEGAALMAHTWLETVNNAHLQAR